MLDCRSPKRTNTESAAQPMAEDIATISASKGGMFSVSTMEVSHKRTAVTFATTSQGQRGYASSERRIVFLAVQYVAVKDQPSLNSLPTQRRSRGTTGK